MHRELGVLFSKMHKLKLYPIYSSEDDTLRIWKTHERKNLLYVVSAENEMLKIVSGDDNILGENMTLENVCQFITAENGEVEIPEDYDYKDEIIDIAFSENKRKRTQNRKVDATIEANKNLKKSRTTKSKKRDIDLEELAADEWE